ncbi:hypothetical protein AWW67_06005 [Roseivirga seohaensis]|uniref:DUF2254 domain-containing protein n=1 Tax=Roseivirga seohaensis TaxID=1914963 RepID=A0A150XWA1_9BACT|nr:DUF2254 domain-containing protein [Roseivirga seohaensis]KYG82978.1 hypothetical protein AWW67_06005 [Roseivirga seohaensis]
MKLTKNLLYKTYRSIIGSIAFYPTLIAVGFLLFSIIIMLIEYDPFMMDLKKDLSFVLVKSKEDARLVLGTLVGSIISLMVFSFSMVMIVLNRASSTLSPRVIPGLITDKSNQVVLGFYLGSIIYSLILIVNVQSDETINTPDFGILLSMIFGITCLAFFMYFIHTISQSIQVDNILNSIFSRTKNEMERLTLENSEVQQEQNTEQWYSLNTSKAGYFKKVKVNELVKLCEHHQIKIQMLQPVGFFFVENSPLLCIDKEIDDELKEEIENCFILYPQEWVSDHYVFGFKQISEIAVKALSPGINDPGTAIKSIHLLTLLYIKKIQMKEKYIVKDSKNVNRVYFKQIVFEQLYDDHITQVRIYGKADTLVMLALLQGLMNIFKADKNKSHYHSIIRYFKALIETCHKNFESELDISSVNKVIEEFNQLKAAPSIAKLSA